MATERRRTDVNGVPDVRGKRVLVYSLGIEGRDLAGWLLRNGASVTVSDTRSETQLAAAGAEAPAGVERVVAGEALLDPAGFDLVAVSQSVLRSEPAIRRANELGIPLTSQLRLALQLCPAPVIGITGSSGKSTTTALVGAIAAAAGVEHLVGGNLGGSLLDRIARVPSATTVILEISHTQLQYTDRSPAIAAVTNVTPNHLDQFSWEEYVGLKRNLLAYQSAGDLAVLNADDPVSREFFGAARGRTIAVSLAGPPPGDGVWLAGSTLHAHLGDVEERLLDIDTIRLRGRHNLANVAMAAAIARAADLPAGAIAEAARTFRGLPHRLELIGTAAGATWVNDSIATAPERTLAALRATEGPVVLLLGGREKNLALDELAAAARERCRAVVCFGEAAEPFAAAVRAHGTVVTVVETLDDAVLAGAKLAQPGDTVLLSPAGTSFDAYPRFEARGDAFRAAVERLEGFQPPEVTP